MEIKTLILTWEHPIVHIGKHEVKAFPIPKGFTPIGVELPSTNDSKVYFGTHPERVELGAIVFPQYRSTDRHFMRIWLQNTWTQEDQNDKNKNPKPYPKGFVAFKLFCVG